MSDLADRVFAFVKERDHVSFAELTKEFPEEFSGTNEVFAVHPGIVVWTGLTRDAYDAVNALVDAGRVAMWPTSFMVYLSDGLSLNLPLAKGRKNYARPHWLPVTLRIPQRMPSADYKRWKKWRMEDGLPT